MKYTIQHQADGDSVSLNAASYQQLDDGGLVFFADDGSEVARFKAEAWEDVVEEPAEAPAGAPAPGGTNDPGSPLPPAPTPPLGG